MSGNIKAIENKESPTDAWPFEAVFNNATISIVLANHSGEIMLLNQFAETQFGYCRNDLVGKQVEILISARTAGIYGIRKDRCEFPAELSQSHFEFEGRKYIILFITDITIRKNAEELRFLQNEELEKRVNEQKALGEIKSTFVSMASHEFRTPLSVILSSIVLVKRYSGAEDIHNRERHISKIQNAVKDLNFILEDFLSLDRLEEGLVAVLKEPLDKQTFLVYIHNIFEELNQSFCKDHRVVVTYFLEEDFVNVDKKLLRIIMVNLLSNAIKYSPEKSVITIDCNGESTGLQISVGDKGIGIPEGDQKYLFERFFRANNVNHIQGTGLGLHIVHRYVDLLGGCITLTSKVNEGTMITVFLPTS